MLNVERLQKPTAKHLIGFHHTSLMDESRNVDGKRIRELPIMIWYPAVSVDGDEPKHDQPRKGFTVHYELQIQEATPETLHLTTQIFSDETHGSLMAHLLASSVRLLWPSGVSHMEALPARMGGKA